jgi:deoxyribose-phosphate aldolase
MSYQVRVAGNITNVKVSTNKPKIKATVASGVIMARTLDELLDVDVTGAVGLPQNFIDTLDVDLDDKIDLDAGSF